MTEIRGLLIAGGDGLVLNALAREASRRDIPYTLAPLPKDTAETKRPPAQEEGGTILDWNAHSPLSARTLVVAARNRLPALDTAILVSAPPARYHTTEPDAAEIDAVIDRHLKSLLFLTRELRALYATQDDSRLAFVAADTGASGGTLGKTAGAAFTAFATALVTSGENTLGFSAHETPTSAEQAGDFAAFILKKISEERKNAAGKWYKYSKLSVFGR